jgi:hypothetical protein
MKACQLKRTKLIKKKKGKKKQWHCCVCCNGRVEFEASRLITSSFVNTGEMKACQLTITKLQDKKIETK